MQIAAYTLAVTSVADHNVNVINALLEMYFCPVFVVHGTVDTLAVCEDKIYVHNNNATFTCYENFLKCPYSQSVAATIQEYGDLDHKIAMIEKIASIMRQIGDGVIVLSNYYH